MALPADLQTDTELWSFALSCWQKPGVAPACLSLQQQGWSVTRILCAAWLANQHRTYTGLEAVTVTEWRNRVTGALREIKRTLPKESETCHDLRAGVARLELEAERVELALAWQTLNIETEEPAMQDRNILIIGNLTAAAPCADSAQAAASGIHQLASALAFSHPGAHST
ncbi:MAG TPA: TIGR02444 family protein [Marinobacter sp.]|nr:TIGR02444 family protein [Marinobacter sp.]